MGSVVETEACPHPAADLVRLEAHSEHERRIRVAQVVKAHVLHDARSLGGWHEIVGAHSPTVDVARPVVPPGDLRGEAHHNTIGREPTPAHVRTPGRIDVANLTLHLLHMYASLGTTTKGGVMKHSLAGLTAVVLIVGGVVGVSPSHAATDSSATSGPSDAEIVEALAYGAGDLARQLGTEVGSDVLVAGNFDVEDYRAKARAASAEVLAAERQRLDPVLADLRSGNVYRAQEASQELGQVVVDHTRRQMNAEGVDPADLPSAEGSGRCGVAVVCVAYAAVGVHNAAVATAAAAVVVSVALWCGAWTWCGKAATGDESAAARERLAVQVATTIR